jgi:hypothetical protein
MLIVKNFRLGTFIFRNVLFIVAMLFNLLGFKFVVYGSFEPS